MEPYRGQWSVEICAQCSAEYHPDEPLLDNGWCDYCEGLAADTPEDSAY